MKLVIILYALVAIILLIFGFEPDPTLNIAIAPAIIATMIMGAKTIYDQYKESNALLGRENEDLGIPRSSKLILKSAMEEVAKQGIAGEKKILANMKEEQAANFIRMKESAVSPTSAAASLNKSQATSLGMVRDLGIAGAQQQSRDLDRLQSAGNMMAQREVDAWMYNTGDPQLRNEQMGYQLKDAANQNLMGMGMEMATLGMQNKYLKTLGSDNSNKNTYQNTFFSDIFGGNRTKDNNEMNSDSYLDWLNSNK